MTGGNFVLAVSDFYGGIAQAMVQSAKSVLFGEGIEESAIEVLHVPGALELPMALQIAASGGGVFAMAALGCVVRGETYHFEIVADTCASGIMQVQLQSGIPIGNGVLTVGDMAQAQARQMDKAKAAVRAALALAKLKQQYCHSREGGNPSAK